jgi:hypothetical protein
MADERVFQTWDLQSVVLQKMHNKGATRQEFIREPEEFNPLLVVPGGSMRGGAQRVDAEFNATMYEALRQAEEAEARRC